MVSSKYGATFLVITPISHDWARQTSKIRGDYSKKNDIGTVCNSRFEIILFDPVMAESVLFWGEKGIASVFHWEGNSWNLNHAMK